MQDATLQAFREIADQMFPPEQRRWQWIGKWESQRHFGITRERAERFAETFGGTASRMEPSS